MEDVLSIYAPGEGPIPPSITDNAEFKPVMAAAWAKLLELFGDVPTVIASPALTKQLLQLPRSALVALLGSDKLTSDCEDSVLMLLSWWLEKQRAQRKEEAGSEEGEEGGDEEGEEEDLEGLMGGIRYSRLSSTHLAQALPLIPDLCPSGVQLAALHQFRALSKPFAALHAKLKQSVCPAGWFKPARPPGPSSKQMTLHMGVSLPVALLTAHLACLEATKEGGPVPSSLATAVHFRGLCITACFRSASQKEFCGVFVAVSLSLPSTRSQADLQLGIPSTISITIDSKVADHPDYELRLSPRFHGAEFGWFNLAQRASKLPGDPRLLSWWDPFLIEGSVHMVVKFIDGRTS
ncbi:MAG: hypothetical protein WDW36_007286 [Sanguina aurantia]